MVGCRSAACEDLPPRGMRIGEDEGEGEGRERVEGRRVVRRKKVRRVVLPGVKCQHSLGRLGTRIEVLFPCDPFKRRIEVKAIRNSKHARDREGRLLSALPHRPRRNRARASPERNRLILDVHRL